MSYPGAPARDPFLHKSFNTIKYVHDNMEHIKKVASHLTPISDLEDFQTEVEAVYSRLGLLVEASELMLQVTEPGYNLMTAVDVDHQRTLLELGSAALHSTTYFASAADFIILQNTVEAISHVIDTIVLDMANMVQRGEFDSTIAGLVLRILALEDAVQNLGNTVQGIETGLGDGTYFGNIDGQIIAITDRLDINDGLLSGFSSALLALTARVEETEDGLIAQSSAVLALTSRISAVELGLDGQANALQLLQTTVTLHGDTLTAHSLSLTQLNSQVTDLDNRLDVAADAIQAVETLAQTTANQQLALASAVTGLSARVTDTENQLVGVSTAVSQLTTRVEMTEDGLEILGQDITSLQASITGTGNLLVNSGFEVDTEGWTLFSRGAGWLASELEINVDEARLPPETYSLSLQHAGVPSGNAGIRTQNFPVEALQAYIVSGYLAAENCTGRLEYRLFDSSLVQVGMGVVGEVTNEEPADNIQGWTRVHARIPIPSDGALLQVQWWVNDANTVPPKAWLLMPMLERAIGNQQTPSPWVPGNSGVSATLASAVQSLTVRVDQAEDELQIISQSQTDLEARIGAITDYVFVTHASSDPWDDLSVGSPEPPNVRRNSSPSGEASLTRGLTLVLFNPDGTIDSATTYDTFSTPSQRTALALALNSLEADEGFLLVSQNNHGAKDEDLVEAIENAGGYIYKDTFGHRPYALLGMGGIGRGNGIEFTAVEERLWIKNYFQLINGQPRGLASNPGVVAIAGAVQTLTATVTQLGDDINALSQDITDLEVIVEGKASASALSLLEARVEITEEDILSISQDIVNLTSRVEDAEGDILGHGSAISSLTTSVNQHGLDIIALGQDLTSLESVVDGKASSAALSALETRVEDTEQGLVSVGSSITELSARIGTGRDNLIIKGTFEDGESGSWNGTVTVEDVVNNPRGQKAMRVDTTTLEVDNWIDVEGGELLDFSSYVNTSNRTGGGATNFRLQCVDKDNTVLGYVQCGFRNNGAAGWVKIEGRCPPILATTTRARMQIQLGGTSGWVYVSDIRLTREQPADRANANALSLLESRVEDTEDGLLAQSTNLINLTAQVHGDLIPGRNLIMNPTGAMGVVPWRMNSAVEGSELVTDTGPILRVTNGATAGNRFCFQDFRHPALPNKEITWSVDLYAAGDSTGSFDIDLIGLDQEGNPNWFPGGPITLGPRAVWTRLTKTLTLPANVYGLRARVRVLGANFSSFGFRNAKLEFSPSATAYSDDVPYSSATQILQATAQQLADGQMLLNAKALLHLNINGKIAGYEIVNDGTTSQFDIIADVFKVSDDTGTIGYTVENGISIWRKGGYMAVKGPGFGAGGEFLEWFGPDQANLALCTRATGISWATITGIYYTKGAMFAGTLTAGGQTKSLIATTYTTGPFGTNGGPIVVNASFAHFRRQMAGLSGSNKNSMSLGGGSTSATIQLWRKVGTGAFAMVASQTTAGTTQIFTDPDPSVETLANWYQTVSITYTDNAGGTQNREYEVRVVSETYQTVNISGSAPVPSPTNERLLGVLTSE